MGLRPELAELLAGFDKRMKFINIGRFLLDYSLKDNIKAMVPDREVLDNLIVAVLVFIKERTLGTEQNCKLDDVADFLEGIDCLLPEDCCIDTAELARFIVVDVFQKSGVLTNYRVLFPGKEVFEQVPIRLIEEERGAYHLTDDAFDYLFRSKEIESELDYSVTRFRMAEYMKRNNYMEALDQSRELVSKVRSMKVSMDDFVRRCRENIAKISVEQYDTVIARIRNLLEVENEELKTIQDNARIRANQLFQADESGVDAQDLQKHRKALNEIIRNIQLAIEEQRALINKKMSLSEAYQALLSDSYAINRYERLSFDADILVRMRKGDLPLDTAAAFLLFPLTAPSFQNMFSIENLYAMQTRLSDTDEEDSEELGDAEEEANPAENRNKRFLAICTALFGYMTTRQAFKVSEFVASLSDEQLRDFCQENALPQVILELYGLQRISISAWKASEEMVVQPIGEFELSWCLNELPEAYKSMDSISITKLDRSFSFETETDEKRSRISMSDFWIEVSK